MSMFFRPTFSFHDLSGRTQFSIRHTVFEAVGCLEFHQVSFSCKEDYIVLLHRSVWKMSTPSSIPHASPYLSHHRSYIRTHHIHSSTSPMQRTIAIERTYHFAFSIPSLLTATIVAQISDIHPNPPSRFPVQILMTTVPPTR